MPQTEAQERLSNLAKKQDIQASTPDTVDPRNGADLQEVNDSQSASIEEKTPSAISLPDVTKKRRIQNLEERKTLLSILKYFFFFQLVVMNVVVCVLVAWVVFDFSFFNDIQSADLQVCVSFMKYYISAILVELLGGIIFVVHKVFSEKF